MKVLSFSFGFAGSALSAAVAATASIAGFAAGRVALGLCGLFLLLVTLFLIRRAFWAGDGECAGSAVWIIVFGAVSSLAYIAFLFLAVSYDIPRDEDVILAVMGVIFAWITLAGGILAIIPRKKKIPVDGNRKSIGAKSNRAIKVTAIVFGFIGAAVNAMSGIIGWFELHTLSDGFEYNLTLLCVMIMLLSVLGAVLLLFSRLHGGVLLIISGMFFLLPLSSPRLALDMNGANVLISSLIPQLFVVTGGVLGIVGYKKEALAAPAPGDSKQPQE